MNAIKFRWILSVIQHYPSGRSFLYRLEFLDGKWYKTECHYIIDEPVCNTDELPEWHENVNRNLKIRLDEFIARFTSAASDEIPIVQDYSL